VGVEPVALLRAGLYAERIRAIALYVNVETVPIGSRREGRVRVSAHLVAVVLVLALMAGRVASAGEIGRPPVVMERVRVALVFDGRPLPPGVAAAAIEEIQGIWAPYGVHVSVAHSSDSEGDDGITLTVLLAEEIDARLAPGTLGSIRFSDGRPQPSIVMYPRAIDALIANVSIAGTHNLQWPTAFHEAIVGRVLGRGVAHEIGHYLLRVRHHPEVGLMRAPHATPDLVAADRQHFGLSIDEQKQLTATIAASLPPSSRPAHHSADYSR
jgi:hypothetical protein